MTTHPPVSLKSSSPAINQHGGSSSVIVYENSHHSFDSIDPVIHVPNAIAVGRRHTVLSKDGFTIMIKFQGTYAGQKDFHE